MAQYKTRDLYIIVCLIIIPFLVYLENLVPETKSWNILGININSVHFGDVNFMAWIMFTKLSIISLLVVWYLTNIHWWRYAIFIPVVIEIYKLVSILDDNFKHIDELEYLVTLPVTLPFVVLLFFLARRVNYFNKYEQLIILINEEIDDVLNKIEINRVEEFDNIKYDLSKLRQRKEKLTSEKYLKKLLELRDRLVGK